MSVRRGEKPQDWSTFSPQLHSYHILYTLASRTALLFHEVAAIMPQFAGWQSCKASCEEPDNGCGERRVLRPAGSQWRWQGHKQLLQIIPFYLCFCMLSECMHCAADLEPKVMQQLPPCVPCLSSCTMHPAVLSSQTIGQLLL